MQDTNQVSTMDSPQATPEASPVAYSKLRTSLISAFFAPGAGLLASLMAVLLMGVLRIVAGIPTPVELFGDFILQHIDTGTFVRLLITFSPYSKTAPLGLALLGMIGIGTLLSLLYAIIARVNLPATGYRPGRREWFTALAFAAVMTLIGVVLFWNEIRQNQFGLTVGWSTFVASVGMLADFGLYGAALCLAYRALLPKQPAAGIAPRVQQRRQLLSRVGVAALSVGSIGGALEAINSYLGQYTAYDGMKTPTHNNVTSPITPNSEHYVVTQNAVDPTPNIDLWRLEVAGLVNTPGMYTYAEFQKLPSTSRAVTLECIASGVGDHLLGTAVWQGVTLRTLLDQHGGAQASAQYATFYSVDGYNISLPLKEVLEADALLAWRMNGTELPLRHGYPVRVLIPGRYGEENPKWVTRVELTDQFVQGLYSSQGWYHGTLHTMSRIDRPHDQVMRGQTVEVGGIAFAGNRGIQKVEVSTDNGMTWQPAKLQPRLSEDSWVMWTWQWKPALTGKYTLVCRATDGTGALQIEKKQGTVPNGATGYHHVTVQVV